MRYVKLLFLIFLVYLSQCLFQTEDRSEHFQLHANLQSDIKVILGAAIAEAVPEAMNIRFERIWSSTLSKDEISIEFRFSFLDSSPNHSCTVIVFIC